MAKQWLARRTASQCSSASAIGTTTPRFSCGGSIWSSLAEGQEPECACSDAARGRKTETGGDISPPFGSSWLAYAGMSIQEEATTATNRTNAATISALSDP